MNTAEVTPPFVNESEALQQYAWIKIPATLYVNLDGRTRKFPVAELSAAGFSANVGPEALRLRHVYRGRLVFEVDGFDFALEVNFVPRSFDSVNARCGCEFQDLGSREVSALRSLISASLSGEGVSADDVLNALARENLVKAPKGKGSGEPGFLGKSRAMGGSPVLMLVGLFVISFAISGLWNTYFVTEDEPDVGSYGSDLVDDGDYSVGQIEEQPTGSGMWSNETCCGTRTALVDDADGEDALIHSDEGETALEVR